MKFPAAILGMILFAAAASVTSVAQSPQKDNAASEAGAAYEARDWAKSTRLYQEMVKAHPEIPRLWFRLATSQQELGQLDQALQTMEQGLALHRFSPSFPSGPFMRRRTTRKKPSSTCRKR